MKEKPILFSGEMVRAILSGRKSQTRRVIKTTGESAMYTSKPLPASGRLVYRDGAAWDYFPERTEPIAKCPYGEIGDQLWVRETWTPDCATVEECRASFEDLMPGCAGPYYRATASDFDIETLRWKPSIHMPRWASRTNLEITDIRVELVQNISNGDAKAEGAEPLGSWGFLSESEVGKMQRGSYRCAFANIWNSINGKPRSDGRDISWKTNPWVWVLTFKRINNGKTNTY